MKKVEALLEKVIFASRWILAPFYLGLSLSLLVLLYEFGREIVHFFTIIHETDIAGVLLFNFINRCYFRNSFTENIYEFR